jgi:hypothetical protein
MTWLGLVNSYEELRTLKNSMVICDNVSKSVVSNYEPVYSDDWLGDISEKIHQRIEDKQNYRRSDMHLVVRKYFDDLLPVLGNVLEGLKRGGRFLIVVGDSLMAGVYIPADLIIARMGRSLGYEIEDVKVARVRRSGQRHDFKLRESIVVLRKQSA